MTHEELLARVQYNQGYQMGLDGYKICSALRVIVELHHEHTSGSGDVYCYNCQQKYPCFTIQAIEKELK
jgi:hypothetical protein